MVSSSAYLTLDANNETVVSSVPTVVNNSHVFALNVEAGKTYLVDFVDFSRCYDSAYSWNISRADENDIVGYVGEQFTATATETLFVWGHVPAWVNGSPVDYNVSDYYVSLTITDPATALADVETLINDALASVKTYIDSKDAGVKTYADGLITQLMQTTDLSAKLALLNEINMILDGDAATAGFQLWESNVAKLNQVIADLNAAKTDLTTQFTTADTTLRNQVSGWITAEKNRIDGVVSTLDTRVTADINAIKASASNPFVSMKAKAATIFAV